MLSESFAIADGNTSSPVCSPWRLVETACASQVKADLRACWDRVVLRRRIPKDTSGRWYHSVSPRSEAASRPGVRIPEVVEDGRVEYGPVALPAFNPPGPSKIRSPPSKRKKKISGSPMKLPRRFEIPSPPYSLQIRSLGGDPGFASALAAQASRVKSRRSVRDRRAAPVVQMGFL